MRVFSDIPSAVSASLVVAANASRETCPAINHAPASLPADADGVFTEVWEEAVSDGEAARFPSRIFWLNGAPGAGKGTHTPGIQRHLGLDTPPIVVSDLLREPAARRLIDAGLLVDDRTVLSLLLARLREPQYARGVIVDGFPRTAAQVVFLRDFHARLSGCNARAGLAAPRFSILVLFVDEAESIARQMRRGRAMLAAGGEVRKTDFDPALAARRYRIFAEKTLAPLETLRGVFPWHLIESVGSIEEVSARVVAIIGDDGGV